MSNTIPIDLASEQLFRLFLQAALVNSSDTNVNFNLSSGQFSITLNQSLLDMINNSIQGDGNISDLTNDLGFEGTTQLNLRDTANRARVNHTGQQSIVTLSELPAPTVALARETFFLRVNPQGNGYQFFSPINVTASRRDALLHQPSTFFNYLQVSANIPTVGKYRLDYRAEVSINTTSTNFESHVRIVSPNNSVGRDVGTLETSEGTIQNARVVFIEHVEFTDAAGTGELVTNTSGGQTNSDTDVRKNLSGFTILENIPSGNYTFIYEFRGEAPFQEPVVYEADMQLGEIP